MSSGPASSAPRSADGPALARVGQVLRGKWRLERLLGVGGMAAVYVGTHRNGKRGAVKVMHANIGGNTDARARFLREGYAANRVGHPGAVSVLDDDVAEDGSVFLVMELLEGETVEARADARPGKTLELPEVLAVADDLLDVLAAAHEKGIIHRDIKPANVFITDRGEIKVLDFGIARLRDGAGSVSMTSGSSVMGTPAFMPPEQAMGNWEKVDARTDLWAVGATMYTLLTGQLVHPADTVQRVMLAAMTKPASPLLSARPDLPPDVGGVVDCALAFDQDARWPNARAMQDSVRGLRARLGDNAPIARSTNVEVRIEAAKRTEVMAVAPVQTAVTASPIVVPPPPARRKERRGPAAASLGLVAVGLVAVGLVAWIGLHRSDSPGGTRSASDVTAPAVLSTRIEPTVVTADVPASITPKPVFPPSTTPRPTAPVSPAPKPTAASPAPPVTPGSATPRPIPAASATNATNATPKPTASAITTPPVAPTSPPAKPGPTTSAIPQIPSAHAPASSPSTPRRPTAGRPTASAAGPTDPSPRQH